MPPEKMRDADLYVVLHALQCYIRVVSGSYDEVLQATSDNVAFSESDYIPYDLVNTPVDWTTCAQVGLGLADTGALLWPQRPLSTRDNLDEIMSLGCATLCAQGITNFQCLSDATNQTCGASSS